MERNRGIDIVRAGAILAVIVYHFYVLIGENRYVQYPVVHRLLSKGGEIGVTLFFIISGYGIFLSIDRQKAKKKFSIKKFFQKRCIRILPQYYLSLLIIIFIGSQSFVLGTDGIFDIVTHALLIHNFFPSTCGSISTVLWTMGVIFQFYIISIGLYKCIKKSPLLTLLISIAFTILCKIIVFHFVFPLIEIESSYYFIYGRQLFTALDNFVIGMFLGCCGNKILPKKVTSIFMVGIAFLVGTVWCIMPYTDQRHSDSIIGYTWSTVLALILGVIVWFFSNIKLKRETWLLRVIMTISKYQYGIYLWHFVVAANLLQSSPWIIGIANHSFLLVSIILCVICTLVGFISTITLEAPDYEKVFKHN